MSKKITNLLGIIILFVLLGILYVQYINYSPNQKIDQKTNQVQIQEKISGAYSNGRFGYEITCEEPWYIWPYFSLEMVAVGQTRDSSLVELEKCIKDKSCGEKLESQLQNFKQEWTVENSDIIFLTDSNQEDQNKFFDEDGRIDLADLPTGRWIQIFPTNIYPDLEKESLKEKNSLRIETKTITLQNGLRAQQVDSRTLNGGRLIVIVPYNFDSKLDSGEQAKSLNFITDAEAGSDSEKAFYEIVNSLSFY